MVILKKTVNFIILFLSLYIFFSFDRETLSASQIKRLRHLNDFSVLAYLPDYRIETYPKENLDVLTDIILFSLRINHDGEFVNADDIDNMFKNVVEYQKKNSFNIWLSFAVHDAKNAPDFRTVLKDDFKRTRFISGLSDFIKKYNFYGLELDWEYPRSLEDKYLFSELILDLKKQISNIEIAVALSPYVRLYEWSYYEIDKLNWMLYDEYSEHSTYHQMAHNLENRINPTLDKKRSLIGVPFYGRGFEDKRGQGLWRRALRYNTMYNTFVIPNDYDDYIEGYYFNNINTIKNKFNLALYDGYGGIMIWELGGDAEGEISLLKSMKKSIYNYVYN